LLERALSVTLGDDPKRRSIMGTAGRKRVAATFDLRTNVSQLLESYGILPARSVATLK